MTKSSTKTTSTKTVSKSTAKKPATGALKFFDISVAMTKATGDDFGKAFVANPTRENADAILERARKSLYRLATASSSKVRIADAKPTVKVSTRKTTAKLADIDDDEDEAPKSTRKVRTVKDRAIARARKSETAPAAKSEKSTGSLASIAKSIDKSTALASVRDEVVADLINEDMEKNDRLWIRKAVAYFNALTDDKITTIAEKSGVRVPAGSLTERRRNIMTRKLVNKVIKVA